VSRPSKFTAKIADEICEELANGRSLRSICSGDGMPRASTVFRWLATNEAFRDQYARAREAQADYLADEIVSIADEECTSVRADKHGTKADDDEGNTEVVFDATAVARNRLRVDARKWVAAKLKPKVYGEKVETHLSGPDGGPLQILGGQLPANVASALAERLKRVGVDKG